VPTTTAFENIELPMMVAGVREKRCRIVTQWDCLNLEADMERPVLLLGKRVYRHSNGASPTVGWTKRRQEIGWIDIDLLLT
jgi:hypothetical protein